MKMMQEIWKSIPKAPGYFVSNLGKVRGSSGNILKPYVRPDKYHVVVIHYPTGRKTQYVHMLVLSTFKGIKKNKVTRHLNGNRSCNYLDNLEWGTSRENSQDMVKMGNVCCGTRHHSNILTESQVRRIHD